MTQLTDARDHDALDEALDHVILGLPVPAPEGLEPLLETAHFAREAFATEVPADVARVQLAALTGVAPIGRKRSRRRLAVTLLAAAVTVVLLAGSAVAASAGALPGQLLYPVKRAVEKIDLTLHRDPASRARLHLQFAERRLDELSTLLELRRSGQNVDIGAAMSAYQAEISAVQAAVDDASPSAQLEALLGHVQDELAGHVAVLEQLRDNVVPSQARDAIQNAIDRAETARTNVMHGRSGGGKPSGTPGGSSSTPSLPPSPGKSSQHR